MAGIFQKVVAKMRQEEKAKAKDDSSITKKPKPIVKPKPKAEDDFEVRELLAWAKNNEPDEGWITNDKIKEIRLRKRYFDKNIDKRMSWLDYLSSKEKKGIIKIVKKSAINKPINEIKPIKSAKDDLEFVETKKKVIYGNKKIIKRFLKNLEEINESLLE